MVTSNLKNATQRLRQNNTFDVLRQCQVWTKTAQTTESGTNKQAKQKSIPTLNSLVLYII